MEYQVLARKWRPQSFADVVGQTHITHTLQNELIQDKTAHAYLFVGPRGIGKTSIARIFAKAMNCKNGPAKEPCCQCESCLAIAEGNSLDLIEIDGASNNSVDDIRQLREEVLYSPTSSRYKIYIIDEVHMLSTAAWNALLKTIEEPPPHAKFLFATTEAHKVLPTVVSRCQRFDLQRITFKLITEQLKRIASSENVNISNSAIEVIARAADGGMRDAQSLLDQMIAFSSVDQGEVSEEQALAIFGLTGIAEMERLILAILMNDRASLISSIHQLANQGKNLEKLFEDILSFLRGIQICMIMQEPEKILETGDDIIALYRKAAAESNPPTVQKLLESLSPVGRLLHDAVNKQVFLETILLKAMRISHAVEIDTLIARLNQIRKGGELGELEQIPSVATQTADSTVPPIPEIPPSTQTEKKTESAPVQSPAVGQQSSTPQVNKTEPVHSSLISAQTDAPQEQKSEPVIQTPPVQAPVVSAQSGRPTENRTEPAAPSQLPPVIPPPAPMPEKKAEPVTPVQPPAEIPSQAPNINQRPAPVQTPAVNSPQPVQPTENKIDPVPPVQPPPEIPPPAPMPEKPVTAPVQNTPAPFALEPDSLVTDKNEDVDFFGSTIAPTAPQNTEVATPVQTEIKTGPTPVQSPSAVPQQPPAAAQKTVPNTNSHSDMPPAFPPPPPEMKPEVNASQEPKTPLVLDNPKDPEVVPEKPNNKPQTPESIWHAAIEDMEHCKQPLLKAYMQEGRPESFINGELTIVYDEESGSMPSSQIKKDKALVETCIRRVSGNKQAVLRLMEKDGIQSPHEALHQNERDLQEIKQRAEKNPFVKDVLELFDASIIDVRG